jgi:hypothetical protein
MIAEEGLAWVSLWMEREGWCRNVRAKKSRNCFAREGKTETWGSQVMEGFPD